MSFTSYETSVLHTGQTQYTAVWYIGAHLNACGTSGCVWGSRYFCGAWRIHPPVQVSRGPVGEWSLISLKLFQTKKNILLNAPFSYGNVKHNEMDIDSIFRMLYSVVWYFTYNAPFHALTY